MRSFFKSRTGAFLFTIHLVVFLYCLTHVRGLSAGESASSWMSYFFVKLLVLDFAIALPLNALAKFLQIPVNFFSDLIFAMLCSVQWWIIGYILEKLVTGTKNLLTR